MPSLAEIVPFPQPPLSWSSHIPLSNRAQFYLYHGLDRKTHQTYKSYQKSFENFCYGKGAQPFPIQLNRLLEWVAVRAEGIPIPGQGPLKADSIVQAVSALRSIHTDRFLSEEVFESPQLKRMLKGVRRVQGEQDKAKAAPLSKIQLHRITAPAPELPGTNDEWEDLPDETTLSDKEINNLNFDTAVKLAFAGFMRTAEITYEAKDLENARVFEHTKL